MSLVREFDTLRNTVNRMLGDFDMQLGGGRRRRRRGGQGFGGLDEDIFDMGFEDTDFDLGWGFPGYGWGYSGFGQPLLGPSMGGIGGPQQLGGGIQQQGAKAGEEEAKQMEVDTGAQGGQLTQQQAGTQVGKATTGPGNLLATFRPEQTLRARVNVEDQKDKYIVTAEMPGFDKQNLKVNISDDGVLSIRGEQTKEWKEQSADKRYLKAERSFSNVARTLRLPKNIDPKSIQASYENGVLHINVPKIEEKESRQEVQIK